ncbi:uncharacterized protein [Rutidosis leptorrhynchoides]|uniref:uncharacterized protein n=1 Tax=Rutidosis leptorrhynchoides TaxID=125765 RepID=UPI003A99839D
MEINGFTQRGDESLYDAWVRFKKLLRACPPHGLTKKEYINTFYRGCNTFTKQYLDSSSGEKVFNALVNLGASINLIPHSLYETLGLGPLKPTQIRIRLANHSFDTAIGITEDILVSIDTLVFPVDFVIIEMKEDLQVPLILGRPFLATADTIILVQRNQFNIGVGEECVTINIREAMKQPSNTDDDECYAFDHIDLYVHGELEKLLKVDTSEFD